MGTIKKRNKNKNKNKKRPSRKQKHKKQNEKLFSTGAQTPASCECIARDHSLGLRNRG